MIGWLYTILRNEFYSEFRKFRREIQDEDGYHAAKVEISPGTGRTYAFPGVSRCTGPVAAGTREALILVGASDFLTRTRPRIARARLER